MLHAAAGYFGMLARRIKFLRNYRDRYQFGLIYLAKVSKLHNAYKV